MVCPVCFHARKLDQGDRLPNAELGGTTQPRAWIGDDGATTLGYRRMNNWRKVMFGSMRHRFWAESVSAFIAAVLALVTVAWPDWIENLTGSAPDGGSGVLERAVVGGLAAAAILLAIAARAEWRRAPPAAR
jgi:hypothetical protein